MNERYIDVDKLTWQVQDSDKYGTITKQVFISLLQNSETADVAPVIHAHWRWMLNHDVICSKCQYVLPSSSPVSDFRFCPFCGAKMDEE